MMMFNPYLHTYEPEQPFTFERLYRHPSSLNRYDKGGARKQIAIIGGGIAGLVSAYELSQLNHHVTLLEADSRLGGRIKTHYFNDGTYGELGAMRIPDTHQCVLHYINKFDLRIQRFISYNPQAFYHLRKCKTRLEFYKNLFHSYNLYFDERQDPASIYENSLKNLIESFSELEKWDLFSSQFKSSRLRHYDSLSLTQFFRELLSPDAFELVGHATGMIHYEHVSLLNGLIDFFAWHQAKQYKLVEGMESLVNAFVTRLPGKIVTQAQVTAVETKSSGIQLCWKSIQGQESMEFDSVIFTIPTTVLRKITFDPPLPDKQWQAINNLGYCSAAKTLFHCTARPWEFEDGIYGGASFTDLNIEKCWYPDDNALLEDKSSNSPRWIGRNPEFSQQSATFTAAYRWESNARKFRNFDRSVRDELTLQEVKQLHPQIEEYVDDIVHSIWDEEDKSGSGAYAFFAPREREKYQPFLGQHYPIDKPRVFFAGEHLAINHASVQGAMQTAVSAVIDLLKNSL